MAHWLEQAKPFGPNQIISTKKEKRKKRRKAGRERQYSVVIYGTAFSLLNFF